MTLEEYKYKWSDEISNWDVKNLKADDEFMADSMNCEEFAAYVVGVKPSMANEKRFKMKFLGLGGTSVGSTEKTPTIEREPVEEISTTEQIIKDLKVYREKQGFI